VFDKISLPAFRVYLVRDVIEDEKWDSQEFVPPSFEFSTGGSSSASIPLLSLKLTNRLA